jgi:site-specific DNA-cytosine methylase
LQSGGGERGYRVDAEGAAEGAAGGQLIAATDLFPDKTWKHSTGCAIFNDEDCTCRERVVTAFHQTQDPIHGDDFTPALGVTSAGMGVGVNAAVRRLTPVECERLQGFPDNWTRLDDKTPDSRRYAALGDAVTVPVAAWIGRRLIAHLAAKEAA